MVKKKKKKKLASLDMIQTAEPWLAVCQKNSCLCPVNPNTKGCATNATGLSTNTD